MVPLKFTVTDREYAQALMALRHWSPAADISLSTRETEAMRDGLIPLMVTKVSAGSCTSVGGYGEQSRTEGQFEISDERDLKTLCAVLARKGLDPVFTDWVPLRGGGVHA